MKKRKTKPTGVCPFCGSRKRINPACPTHRLVTAGGTFTQLGLFTPAGEVRGVLKMAAKVKLNEALAAQPGPPPPPKRREDYVHTSGKCAYCGLRLRNKDRIFHRECDKLVDAPAPKPKPKLLMGPTEYPPSRWCPFCRSLDNSAYAGQFCRSCGRETTDLPDYMKPKGTQFPAKRPPRIRGT